MSPMVQKSRAISLLMFSIFLLTIITEPPKKLMKTARDNNKNSLLPVNLNSYYLLCLSSIPMCLEVEVEGQNTSFKWALKAALSGLIPLSINDLKCDVFVRGTSAEAKNAKVVRLCRLKDVFRRFCRVDKVGIEDIEFIPLHSLWWRIIMIIVSLIVLIPIITSFNTIEVTRLAGTIFFLPWRVRAEEEVGSESPPKSSTITGGNGGRSGGMIWKCLVKFWALMAHFFLE